MVCGRTGGRWLIGEIVDLTFLVETHLHGCQSVDFVLLQVHHVGEHVEYPVALPAGRQVCRGSMRKNYSHCNLSGKIIYSSFASSS
jgi:hypothetical protein